MADVHLANAPRHVGGWPGDFDAFVNAELLDGVDIIHPHRHPHALVAGFGSLAECGWVRAFAASALPALAQEDFEMANAHRAKRRRAAPFESFLKAELFKPLEALLDVGDV